LPDVKISEAPTARPVVAVVGAGVGEALAVRDATLLGYTPGGSLVVLPLEHAARAVIATAASAAA
jgi:hypothetical protein